ncbi:MAG: elongation factor G [Negativibacillus massiliensis]|uniref:elongation factor G n=1 Tax=Negativibacillus massiliensis TaxID=1871035 RepID=UPI0003364E42|nr:elongation factor G [Negativibacillus massiliensis]MCI6348061.1 elongation factor G [Negativibacillus massiliensis]MDY4048137.1 elongation factor G [Negativibacillus massiliensis]CDA79155.1 putative translation elongation factor G [Clostridium sp. CAG:242]
MRQYLAGRIRNIALTGHSGSGKTSLTEALLFKAGATDRLGKVADGNTVSDYDPEEIKRQVSVSTSIAPFAWGSTKINLIDTPGLFDFAGETVQGVRAAESLLICVSGKSGVDVGTEKAYKMAKDASKATMFFVSKLDADHADFYKVFEELKATFGPTVCPIVVPYVEDREVKSYINLIDMKAYTYDEKGEPHEVEMPDFGHRLDGLTAAVSEAVAETDEALFEKYFSGEQFTRDEIIRGVHTGVTNGSISPVLCGCTTNLQAIDMLLDGIVDLLPSPWEKGGEVAVDADGEPVEVVCTDEAPLAAYVFKTIADPFIGKLSYIKVISGKLSADMTPINSRTGQPERLGKIIYVRGKKQEDTAYITAGDIGAVTKLAATETGDALCDPKKVLNFDPINFPKPCLQMAIKTEAKGDESKIASGLQRLMEEDPTIAYENNAETHQQLVSGLGEQHLDVLVSKLKNKFGVSVSLEVPRVAYRETIRKKVKVQGKHKKQSGGHGQFGDVWIEFEPTVGDGLVFEEKVFGGAVPKSFFPAVEKGLQDCVKHGVLAGYPVVGLKATLVDGSYHPVDSSEMSFKMAASIAYKNGMPEASPVLLEPIGNLKVYVPDSNTGDIIGDLNKRRGRVLGMNPSADGLQEIEADVPMSEMSDFATAIRSMTQGRGYFTFDFARYEQLPSNLEAKVIEEAKKFASEE